MYTCPVVAITSCYQLSDFINHIFFAIQFWKQEIRNESHGLEAKCPIRSHSEVLNIRISAHEFESLLGKFKMQFIT